MRAQGVVLVVLIFFVLPVTQASVYLASLPFADSVDVLNFSSSIVAYHWLLANVILSLKVPVFQKILPYDARIRFHVGSTMGLVILLAWHALATIVVKPQLIDFVSWILMFVFGGLVFLSLLWVPLPGLKTFRVRLVRFVRFGFLKSYDWLKGSHKVLFLLLAAFTYVHLVQSEILGLVPVLSSLEYQLLFLVTAVLFIWTRIHNLTLPTLEVQSVTLEGGIVRLTLSGHPRLRYRSGQFAFLRFSHRELRNEEHPFSFTTACHEPGIGFAVRALGDFTGKLASLKPGDRVKVNGGFGAFHPAPGSEPLALIGSGVGSVPLISILKELERKEPDREVVCLFSVIRRDELLEPGTLRNLQESMPHLKLKIFVYKEDGQLYGPDLLARELGQAQRYRYYLCSSEKVRGIVIDALKTLGVKRGKIHYEAFNFG
jgi:predicted ferric reductase